MDRIDGSRCNRIQPQRYGCTRIRAHWPPRIQGPSRLMTVIYTGMAPNISRKSGCEKTVSFCVFETASVMGFEVTRWFRVPMIDGAQIQFPDMQNHRENLDEFFESTGMPEDSRGVYFLGFRSRQGWTRIRYVGKAIRQSFRQEAFQNHKVAAHYTSMLNEEGVLQQYRDGGAVIIGFLRYTARHGTARATNRITEMEKSCITLCDAQFGDFLSNRDGRRPSDVWVTGMPHFGGEVRDSSELTNLWADVLGVPSTPRSPAGVRMRRDFVD